MVWLENDGWGVEMCCMLREEKSFVYHMEATPTKCVDICVYSKPLVIWSAASCGDHLVPQHCL